MGVMKATDEEIIERVRECYDAGETIDGGGVTAETAAAELPIKPSSVTARCQQLVETGRLERDYGFDKQWTHRIGYRVADDADADAESDENHLIADGGTTAYCCDHEACPREDCNSNLQQQDVFTVMYHMCERVWSHYTTGDEHILSTSGQETVARKPRVATDGGVNLRNGETRDDDRGHGSGIVAQQLAEADEETLEQLEGDDDRPNWTPIGDDSADASRRCQNCGAQVSREFRRVMGDENWVAHACPQCTENRNLPREASNAGGGLR